MLASRSASRRQLPSGWVALRLKLRVEAANDLSRPTAGLVRVVPVSTTGGTFEPGVLCGPVAWGDALVDWKIDLPPDCDALTLEFDEAVAVVRLASGRVRAISRWSVRGRSGWAAAKLLWKSPRGLWDDVARFVARRTLSGQSRAQLPAPDRHPQCRRWLSAWSRGAPRAERALAVAATATFVGRSQHRVESRSATGRAGDSRRFLSTDLPAPDDPSVLWNQLERLTGGTGWRGHVEQASAHDSGRPVEIGRDDRVMATAWWTLCQAGDALARLRDSRPWYLIQDYEPGLYAWSAQYALARGTYDGDHLPVVCGRLLYDHLRSERVGRFADPDFAARALVFEPAIDRTLFHPDTNPERTRSSPRRLMFYARPDAPRNLYELGLIALRRAVDRGRFASRVGIVVHGGQPRAGRSRRRGCHPTGSLGGLRGVRPHAARLRCRLVADAVAAHQLSPVGDGGVRGCGRHEHVRREDGAASGRVVTAAYRLRPGTELDHEWTVGSGRAVRPGEGGDSSEVNVPATWEASFAEVLAGLRQAWREPAAGFTTVPRAA